MKRKYICSYKHIQLFDEGDNFLLIHKIRYYSRMPFCKNAVYRRSEMMYLSLWYIYFRPSPIMSNT